MNVWIKRSLGTAALAGGLLFAGSAMANADENHSTNDTSTGSGFSSPITIGGIDAGVTSERSSSSSSTVTRTDDDGDTTTETRSAKDASKNTAGLSTDGISANPAGAISQMTSRSDSSDDDGDDSSSTKQSNATDVEGAAPVTIGGVHLTGTSEQASENAQKSTISDENGTRTSESASQSASKTGTDLGTKAITANPQGILSDRRDSASSSADDGDRDAANSSSATRGDLGSPVSIGGATAAFTDERSDADSSKETVTDEDGTRSQSHNTATASRTQGGFDLGSLTADPMGTVRDQRSSSSAADDDSDENSDASTSDSSLGLAAPFRGEGLSSGFSREDASATQTESVVSDEDGTSRRTESQESASREALGGSSGAFGGDPALGLVDTRSQESAPDDDDTQSASTSDSRGSYAFPYFYDGFALGGDFASQSARTLTEQDSDENGSTTRTESQEDSQRTTPGHAFDGFSGSPDGDFSLQQLLDETNSDS